MEILQKVLTILFVVNCFFLVLLILIQSNRSAGMSLFGGGGSQSAFGSSSGDVLTKATGVMTTIFLLLGLTIAWLGTSGSSTIQELQEEFIENEQSENLQGENQAKDKDTGKNKKKEVSHDSASKQNSPEKSTKP